MDTLSGVLNATGFKEVYTLRGLHVTISVHLSLGLLSLSEGREFPPPDVSLRKLETLQ